MLNQGSASKLNKDKINSFKTAMPVLVTAIVTLIVTITILWYLGFLNPGDQKFDNAMNILKSQYYKGTDNGTLIDGAITGMAGSLKDPYTVYYSKNQMKAFNDMFVRTEESFVGIGVQVLPDEKGIITVIEPFEGSPAEIAGIKPGDKIYKVDDKDVTELKDADMVVKLMQGPENTKVKITVFRESEGTTIDFELIRKKINSVINIKSKMLENNIGYISLKMFDEKISDNFKMQLKKLLDQGAKGLIIDVRNNPGGIYSEAVGIADRLLPEGTIVYTEDKNGKKEVQKSDKIELGRPLAILVNGNSASASEVLAGAVKDYKKGVLIGTKTYGKGLVQTTYDFKDGSGIKVTIARYFTPNGICIQGIGIQPDIAVQLDDKYKDTPVVMIPPKDDTQLNKAIEIIQGQIK
jgi:carboxyl-terminal processing protease